MNPIKLGPSTGHWTNSTVWEGSQKKPHTRNGLAKFSSKATKDCASRIILTRARKKININSSKATHKKPGEFTSTCSPLTAVGANPKAAKTPGHVLLKSGRRKTLQQRRQPSDSKLLRGREVEHRGRHAKSGGMSRCGARSRLCLPDLPIILERWCQRDRLGMVWNGDI